MTIVLESYLLWVIMRSLVPILDSHIPVYYGQCKYLHLSLLLLGEVKLFLRVDVPVEAGLLV